MQRMWCINCRDLTSLHVKMWLLTLLFSRHGNCTEAKGTEISNLLQNDYPYITMWITFLLMAASALAFTIIGSTQPMKLRAHACKSNLASIWFCHLVVSIFNVHFCGRHANVNLYLFSSWGCLSKQNTACMGIHKCQTKQMVYMSS